MVDSIIESDKPLRLFVVGEVSPDPHEWVSDCRVFVVAESGEKAVSMTDVSNSFVEIPMNRPGVFRSW